MWKNYEDLEESLVLDELLMTYEKIMENRIEHMEFQAKVAGAEIKKTNASQDQGRQQDAEAPKTNLIGRLRNKTESDKMKEAVDKGSSTFSDGVGYQVI